MPVEGVVSQINDDHEVDVLRPRHDHDMIEVVVIGAVDTINKGIVDHVTFEIVGGNRTGVGSDVKDIGGIRLDVLHSRGHRCFELVLG